MKEFEINEVKIKWLKHASVLIEHREKAIYIDPYELEYEKKAFAIFVTHEHFDHCDPSTIQKIATENTYIIAPKDCLEKIENYKKIEAHPNESKEVDGIKFETVPAYNIKRFRAPGVPYHPKENNWVGYVLEINGVRIYHAGDTDFVPEMENLKVDVALVPIGGTFTMDVNDAIEFAKKVKPKYLIPIHYNTWPNIIANPKELLNKIEDVEVILLERILE